MSLQDRSYSEVRIKTRSRRGSGGDDRVKTTGTATTSESTSDLSFATTGFRIGRNLPKPAPVGHTFSSIQVGFADPRSSHFDVYSSSAGI